MPHLSFLLLILRLIRNGIRYRYLKFIGSPSKPTSLSLEVTQKCIARCIMCNIWKISRNTADLPMNDWLDLLASPLLGGLRELDITGGEPFIREDLLDLIEGVALLKENKLKRLRSVAITTNGLLTQHVLETTPKMADILGKKGVDLVIVCAMDGVGAVHDQIRNVRDAWGKVNRTIQGLREVRDSHMNLVLGLKATVLPQNVNELERITIYANENGLFTIISPCIITENRYQNLDQRDKLTFSQAEIERVIQFYQRDYFQWDFHRDRLLNYFRKGVMKKPCSAGFNYLFIRSGGDVYPCPLIKTKLGNFKKTAIEEMFISKKAYQFRRRVGRYKECGLCTEPGLERYALPFEGFVYLSLMAKMGKKDFVELHKHMGLDKYFS